MEGSDGDDDEGWQIAGAEESDDQEDQNEVDEEDNSSSDGDNSDEDDDDDDDDDEEQEDKSQKKRPRSKGSKEEGGEKKERAPREFDVERTVFAGMLPYKASEDEVKMFFAEAGQITRIRMLKQGRRPAGAAFVEFSSRAQAQAATKLDGEAFLQRKVRVNFANERPPKGGTFRVYVGNVAFTTTEKMLRKIFGNCGKVLGVDLPLFKATGKLRGFAVIHLDTKDALERALKLNGLKLDGRELKIQAMEALKREEIQREKQKKRRRKLAMKRSRERRQQQQQQGDAGVKQERNGGPRRRKSESDVKRMKK